MLNRNGDLPKPITKELRARSQMIIQSGLVVFCLIVVLLSWTLTLNQLAENRKSLFNGLNREQCNLTSILAENLFQMLEQKQVIELFALGWLSNHREKSLNDITRFLYGGRSFNRVVLYELTGRSFYQSSPHRRIQLDHRVIKHGIHEMAVSGKPLVIDCPHDSPGLSWHIPILFPLEQRGKIQGAMLLELDLGYILNLFQNINIGKTGKIMIFTDLGEGVARFESGGLVIGNALARMSFPGSLHQFSGSGVFTETGGEYFHLAYQRVQDYPFIITVSQGLDEFLSEFDTYKKQQLYILSVLTLFCLVGFYYVFRMINRKHQYLSALAVSNMENNELIVKLEAEHQKAVNAASYDALTHLYNRRLFIVLARKSLTLAKRNGCVYAVLFIDLDRFKTINDTLGHRIGDLLLKTVADRLVRCTRKSDIVGRFGGDEFVIMLTEMSTEKDVSPIVEKIISVVKEPCDNLDGHQIITSPSIGVAVYPRDGEDIDTLIRNADAAMYKSKRSGRGRCSFFDASLNTVSIQKFELEQRMPSAIADDEFVLHYQPKVSLQDYCVVGLEALVRWQHPDYDLIYPVDFIKNAEESGMVVELGNWVLETVCRQMVKWCADGLRVVPVAINVSPRQLKDKTYARHFFETLNRYELCPENIEIEVTENAFVEDKDIVIENLKKLFSGGIRISLDDFGNGFSSLNYIRSLPISALKIDRSFVQNIRNSNNDNAIIASTIILAKKLNLIVVAEGIESQDQLVSLKIVGCDQVQGYLFSRPVPEKEIREFITSPLRTLPA